MRHHTRTTPSAAANSTPPLSARIEALERELHRRYLRRPGQMEARDDWVRYVSSGSTSVFPANAEDAYQRCLAGLAADRARTKP